MPKQTRETNTEGIEGEGTNACIHETNKFMLCFPEVFQQLYDRDCSCRVIINKYTWCS